MRFFLTLLLLASFLNVPAQNEIPAFGKIDKADLEKTDCDYDKGAEAEVLIDWGNMYYDRGTYGISLFKTVFERRQRIKILKESGIPHADIRVSYYGHNNDEKILRVSAYTYNLDASGAVKKTEVGKSSIYSKRINNYYSELIIAFPEVKVGSVIEYKYTMERETMGQLRDWYFQGSIPVRYSQYQLTIPQIFRFSVLPSVVDPVEKKQDVINERIPVNNGYMETQSLKSSYTMRNLPGIKNEPFISTPRDYLQRLEFQLSQIDYGNGNVQDLRLRWSDVVKDLVTDSDFGLQLEKKVNGLEDIVTKAGQISKGDERIKFVFNNLRKAVSWDGDESIYTENGIAKTWESKNGNTADINLLLVKLLRDAGITADPILFSTRDNGLVNTRFPFIKQFNTVMAYATYGDRHFVLDATDRSLNYTLVPANVTNSMGFVVTGENGEWKEIFAGKNKFKIITALHGDIDADGNVQGNGIIYCYDYARKERCKEWVKDKAAFNEDYFSLPGTSYNIADLTVNNLDADSLPLEQKVKFAGPLNGKGDYRYFTVNLFSGLSKNPFIAEDRVSDIDFGYSQEYTIYGNYSIPEEYMYDGLPGDISMIMPDTSIVFTRSVQTTANLLNIRISVEFKNPYYPATLYPEFAAFYKKMLDKLNEQIVIKKKGS